MMPCDVVESRGKSLIQHGQLNNRVYIMELDPENVPETVRFADQLAGKNGYTKIFAKVPESFRDEFADAGYVTEATIPFFFRGREPALFMAKYSDPERQQVRDRAEIADVLSASFTNTAPRSRPPLPEGFTLRRADAGDAEEIARLYRTVFPSYPFPIFEPSYIRRTMLDQVGYFLIRSGGTLAAAASCGIDTDALNVEMTDFATDPTYRGRGLAGHLLPAMEHAMRDEGILLAYTIARAISRPITATFAGAGYRFGGLLPKNTHICGSIEHMNVFYKQL